MTWWTAERGDILLPVTVLPEVCYLVQRRLGVQAELRFVRAVADGEFTVAALESADVERAAELLETYQDLAIGFVDASVVAFAERLDTETVLTTDRRHFGAVRPRHAGQFRLVP
jgi:uncharacterized protein